MAVIEGDEERTSREAGASNKTHRHVARKRSHVTLKYGDSFGKPEEYFSSWAFDANSLSLQHQNRYVIFTIANFHDAHEGYVRNEEEQLVLSNFVHEVAKQYNPNPFHSYAHATDVVWGTARIHRTIHSEAFLSDLEQFCLLIAAVAHDVGHPGYNNGFLAETGHELALMYNDRSPLENMHSAKLFQLLQDPKMNVFAPLSPEQWKESRKLTIECILHTDMIGHQQMVKELQALHEVISACVDSNAAHDAMHKPETKQLLANTILHSADVSNPCRSWETTQVWAGCLFLEFFAQGDEEKSLGIPVQFLNDREKLNKPNSQIGFLEFMIAPFFAVQISLFPKLAGFGTNLSVNIGRWQDLWVAETNPTEEDSLKVRARVEKVKGTIERAIMQKS